MAGLTESKQRIIADGGVASGVVGADMHVHGDPEPVLLLADWPFAPNQPDHSPGQEQLHEWLERPERLAARWLHGRKSHLAGAVAAQARSDGWRVVRPVGSDQPPPPRTPKASRGVLLIVEDANDCPYAELTWLFSNALLHQPDHPARILLIARSLDRWPAVRAALAGRYARTDSQQIEADD
jgi:hypothetical protein